MTRTPAVAAACAEQRLCYSSPYNFDFAGLEGLESLKVDNIKPQKIASSSPMATVPYSGTSSFHHRDESWVCRPAQSTSCRRSSMRKWRNCTPQSLLRNKKITSASSLMSLSRVQGSFDGVVAGSVFEAYLPDYRGSRSGRTLRGWSSSAGRPRHESSIAKNYLESSSIKKNCLRSSSTWTSGVHRDKESPTKSKVQKPDWYTSDQSSRRDYRVSTNPGSWIGAQRRV